MSRRTTRTTVAAAIASAAVVITVAVGVFLTSGASDSGADSADASAASVSQSTNVRASGALTTEITASERPPSTHSSHLTRPGVDWSAVFALTVPSLVTVVSGDSFGSGFFVSDNGHVITNLHIISRANSIVVYTYDGERRNGRLIARDVGNDLALLKIDPKGIVITLPKYAPGDDLRVGQPVGALGAPFGLTNSLSVGIISGLGRERNSGNGTYEPIRDMIQTDAVINPGNSGGMLVDAQGRVIGIPTQIITTSQPIINLFDISSGVGFAVGADAILRALPTLLTGTDYRRSFLGVIIDQSEDRLTVDDVACGFTADRARVRDGDVILRINSQPTPTLADLTDALLETKPGDEITITVRREQRTVTLESVASAWPSAAPRFGCG